MAPEPFTVRLDEDAAAWVNEQTEERDRSKAWVVREAVDAVGGAPSVYDAPERTDAEPTGAHRTGAEHTAVLADLRDRVDDLAEQVANLEGAGVDDVEDPDPAESGGSSPPADAIESEAASVGTEREEENTTDGSDETAPRAGSGTTDVEGRPDAADDVRERLRAELPGSGRRLEGRVDAIVAMRDELRERGEATRDDLLAAADVEATGYSDANSFWKNAVAGRDTLRALPGVEAPSTGNSVWWWTGEESDDGADVYDPTGEF
jgi:hypothetical protein